MTRIIDEMIECVILVKKTRVDGLEYVLWLDVQLGDNPIYKGHVQFVAPAGSTCAATTATRNACCRFFANMTIFQFITELFRCLLSGDGGSAAATVAKYSFSHPLVLLDLLQSVPLFGISNEHMSNEVFTVTGHKVRYSKFAREDTGL